MTDDKNLSKADLQTLATRDGVVAFFASLGYRTDARQTQSVAAMGITADSLKQQINHIERIAIHDNGAEPLDVYLAELTSVTVATRQGLARALRNRVGNYMLVLTDDYEHLDFVLLQRSLPMFTRLPMMATKQVTVLPRVLTVNRRDPTQVHLRVLRRFTYTEADPDAQYDKLLSAYTVADWSEPLFNNRALFSDYYLNERLPELLEWRERPEGVYHRLRELLAGMRQPVTSDENASAAQPIVESALELLGFKLVPAKGANDPDYRLYDPDNPGKPMAVCLAYPWNRYLDGRDETRDLRAPDENPGARVVTVLESGEAPWAIVTNGKLWRLYSSRTHSRSTNYYEIDLDETLAMNDPNQAFRYFWLFFRLGAFLTKEVQRAGSSVEMSFLDRLMEESESYAKGLGERLKERVFEQVFPHFAAGFLKHAKKEPDTALETQLALEHEPDEEFRRQVFNGTLTLLYRLLFLLYAESRDLLPVKEVRGYWERSLAKLKADVADKAGAIMDEAPDRLRRAYGDSTHDTELYDRLLALFSVIDRGSRDLNVPLYNGGLFITKPDASDYSQESETARFLTSHKIPDRYLALGLDLMTRDLDDKRQDLVFIDYKSLGVRQLGSIYEGLLEFRVRVAPEKMAVVKGKKSEEVIPYQEAVRAKKKVLTVGRGRKALERVYQPGEVYLENDRRERKASGSYYTPDHIVKYIVENTVGPVLTDRFDKLRPAFRMVQKQYQAVRKRDAEFKKIGQDRNEADKIVRSENSRKLVDELFDLKVLDPAMGSGHFLVEAVDFICDRILGQREGFLRAFPWNPLTRYLQDTREAIVTEMERQGVTVDAGRLTDINLLKRHVLKRCVYGVDLNPMAVELAKVSLWLDCFTIGAPLSFLDHHLKCGNSLIGTTVQEVEAELAKREEQNLSLFGGPFQGLLAATATIEELRRIPDATVEQAEQSHNLYARFERAQAPYKTALDIWVSQHFGNKRAQEYLTLAGGDLVEQIRTGGEGLSKESGEAITNAREIGAEKRFFHWDLEFPEAFVNLDGGRWRPREEQGFDAVVGNPPYDVLAERELGYPVQESIDYFRRMPSFKPALGGKLNLYKLFVARDTGLSRNEGIVGQIVPMPILADKQALNLRRFMLSQTRLLVIEAFPQHIEAAKRVFEEANLTTCVFVARRVCPEDSHVMKMRVNLGRFIEHDSDFLRITLKDITKLDAENLTIPICNTSEWEIIQKILNMPHMEALAIGNKSYQGEINESTHKKYLSRDNIGKLVLRGANTCRYVIRNSWRNNDLFIDDEGFLHDHSQSSKAWHSRHERVGFQRSAPQNNFRRLIAAPIPEGNFCFDTVSYFLPEKCVLTKGALLALMNSEILDWYFDLGSTNSKVNEYRLNSMPIPKFSAQGTLNEEEFLSRIIHNNDGSAKQEWVAFIEDMVGHQDSLPRICTTVLEHLVNEICQIEEARQLGSHRDRSSLSSESQNKQEMLDYMIFSMYGLSESEMKTITDSLATRRRHSKNDVYD